MTSGVLQAKLEAAFTARWYTDLTDPSIVWTDLTDRVIQVGGGMPSLGWRRGRSSVMQRTPQPGGMDSITLDSLDGALTPGNTASPYYPNVAPGLPVRLSVFDGSQWVRAFTGFATDVQPVAHATPIWTQVDLTVTDGWSRIAQAGVRLAYRDRVLSDLAAPGDVSRLLPDSSEVRESTGVHVFSVPPNPSDGWGVGVWRLDAGGTIDWSKPGAAGVLAEVGGGYASGSVGASTTALTSDRYGGAIVVIGGLLSTTCGTQNTASQQVSVARGPVQLLPASTFDPTTTSGWTTTNGATLAPGGVPSFVAARYSLDPATGARTAIVDGPAHSMDVHSPSVPTVVSLPVAGGVVAGRSYGAHVRCSYTITSLTLQFLDSSGAQVGSVSTPTSAGFASTALTVAPAGAVSARMQVSIPTSAATTTLYAPGIYEGASPARWWRGGEPLQLFAQWPFARLPDGTIGEWLHFRCPADVLGDGKPHLVAWNRDPGVGGVPTVWVDGVAVSGTWEVSTAPSRTAPPYRSQLAAGTGTTAALTAPGDYGAQTADPSKVTAFLAITGVTMPYRQQTPSQALVTRWMTQYGNPALWPQPASLTGTSDVLMGSMLDALGWPKAMRALQTGQQSTSLSWARLAYGSDGSDPTPPGDYSSDISNLAEAEFGWADVDGAGFLRWLPRGWYDPDGTGTALAALHLTYESDVPGAVTYTTTLTQQMGEADVINQVYVTNQQIFSGSSVLLEDYDSQDRIGIRRGEFVNQAWSAPLSVATEILGLYGSARLVASSVTVQCFGADDPKLPVMLDLDPADVVIVTVPRAPAADMDLSCLVTQIAATTDGLVTTFTLTLSPCPVPAVLDERVFLGLDTDGIPYIDPIRKPDAWHISLGGDGYYYLDTAGADDAAVDDAGVVYVRSGT